MIVNDALKATEATVTGLGWVERYGGVSFKVTKDMGGGDVPVYKTFPISETLVSADCFKNGKYKNLCPNSRYKNLLYWEVTSDARNAQSYAPPKGYAMQATVRLVYWLNLPKMGIRKVEDDQNGLWGLRLVSALADQTFSNRTGVSLELMNPRLILKDSRRIFPYDFDYAFDALMVYPHAFGAVEFDALVRVSPDCLTDAVTGVQIECIQEW